jgi:hypothetical protein
MGVRGSIKQVLAAAVVIALYVAGHVSPLLGQNLQVGLACGAAGTSVWFDVTLDPQGDSIGAVQNDITFNSTNAPITTCTKNTELASKDLSLSFLPSGCAGSACTTVRAIVLSLSNTDAILTPMVLYRCRVDIPANATPGNYPLAIHDASGSDPISNRKTISGISGQVSVTSGSCGC